MSLAVLADHMASKGRGPDSMLIHMSPREVQGLQALAKAHGGSLTINPETGLPEAGILDKLLPTILGVGLSFIPGVGPMMAAGIVGGIQTARTGDIGKGLAAGLGAYGGAGLAQGLSTAGASALGSEAALGAGIPADIAANLTDAGVSTANADIAGQAIQQAQPSMFDKMSAGFNSATSSPEAMGQFAKANAKNLMYAAGPAIMAGANVQAKGPQTVTKPGMIRPYSFDPYGGTYTAGTPYEAAPTRAAEGGLMGMNAGGYAPGQLDFAQRSEPVVRMAEGGIAGYAPGGYVPTDAEIFEYFKAPNLTDTQIAADMQKFGVSAADIARATGTQGQQADYEKRFVNTLVAPGTDASEFMTAAKSVGLQDQALANAMQNAGLSQGAQYALTHGAQSDAGFTGGIIDASTGKPVNLYNQLGYTAGALPGDQGGLEGLYGNINYVASGLQNLIDTGKMSVADAQNAALAELARTNVSVKDVKAATGKDFGNLFMPKKEEKKVVTPITTVTPTGFYGNDTGNSLTRTPGDITSNPDGTVTVQPNIPGRPDGGFPGMASVRDAYTAGGGSLGYIPYAPKTIEEFEAKYNKLTGGSKQSYDYLTGKTPYDPVPSTPTGEIMKPYWESVGRFPVNTKTKKYLFKDGKYVLNPDYVKPSYVLAGEKAAADKETAKADAASGKSISVIDNQGNTEQAYMREDGFYYTSGGNKFDEKGVQLAADGGLMAMARGGMAQQFNLGDYSDGGRLLRGPGDGVSDSIPATIGNKRPARLADGEFVVPARIVSELGNGSTEAGARKLYAMMDRIQKARRGTVGKGRVAKNSRSEKYLPA